MQHGWTGLTWTAPLTRKRGGHLAELCCAGDTHQLAYLPRTCLAQDLALDAVQTVMIDHGDGRREIDIKSVPGAGVQRLVQRSGWRLRALAVWFAPLECACLTQLPALWNPHIATAQEVRQG